MTLLPNPLIIPVGLVIGVLVSAPVGPVNVLCIQRAIQRGFFGGAAAGIGAVLGDGLIAFCAAMGVNAISGAVNDYRTVIQIVGGLALLAFGAKLYLAPPQIDSVQAATDQGRSFGDYLWDIPQTFFLTITNPGAVLGLFAIFGGVSTFVEVKTNADALALVAATMAGSFAWWIGLSHAIGRIRHKLSTDKLGSINAIAGALLAGFGVLLLGEIALKAVHVL